VGEPERKALPFTQAGPNKGMEPTAYSVRSYLAPASGSGLCLAFGVFACGYSPIVVTLERTPERYSIA